MSTNGSMEQRPAQPTVATLASMFCFCNSCSMACITSLAPAEIPQVPMPTVIFVPVSDRTFISCWAFSFNRLNSSKLFSFGIGLLLDGRVGAHFIEPLRDVTIEPFEHGGVCERDTL